MQELGEKFKSLFKPKDDGRFKGPGRRLGEAPAPAGGPGGPRGVAGGGHLAPVSTQGAPGQQAQRPTPSQPQPHGPLHTSRSHRTQDVVLDTAVMANTPTAKEAHLLAAHKAPNGDAGGQYGSPAAATPSRAAGEAGGRPLEGGGSHVASRQLLSNTSGVGGSMVSTISTPTAAEKRLGSGFRQAAPPADGAMADYGVSPASAQAYELQRCLGHVLSWEPQPPSPGTPTGAAAAARSGAGGGGGAVGARESCEAMLRVLRNVLTKPGVAKFRQIRLSNARAQATLVDVPGAVEFLEAAGFKMQFSPDDGTELANTGFLVLPDEVPPSALAEAFRILSAAMVAHGFPTEEPPPPPAPASPAPAAAAAAPPPPAALAPAAAAASAAPAPPAPAVDRATQVILPAAPDVQVPEWFFERTGAEIKAQWTAMMRRREAEQHLVTRAMRERQQQGAEAAAGRSAPDNVAIVRVRFPEGVCLQGYFGASEPVGRVFEWVTAALRSPALTFDLVKPDRKPLTLTGVPAAPAAAAARRPAAAAAARPVPLTVRSADLMPSVLLNLRPTGEEAAAAAAARVPLLSDAMLRTTQAQ